MLPVRPWLGAWLNKPYRLPHRRFRVWAEDGVPIVGVHIRRAGTDTLLVYAHGFLSNKNHRAVPRFVEALSTAFDVISFDFRGHGESGGRCSFGAREVLDVAAVVAHARTLGYCRVVLVGSSMGGAVAIHYAAERDGVDGVVTIGAFDGPDTLRSPTALVGLRFLFRHPLGHWMAALMRGARLAHHAPELPRPIEVVERVQVPLLFIHGEWDALIKPEAARRLYARARAPKDVYIVPRKGHDIPLLTPNTASVIARWVQRRVVGGEVLTGRAVSSGKPKGRSPSHRPEM